MVTISSKILGHNYYCKDCGFLTQRKQNYTAHLLTAKHQKQSIVTKNNQFPVNLYDCVNCGKPYASRMGLWRHSKICGKDENTFTLMEKNNKLLEKNQELTSKIIDICQNNPPTNTITYNHSHNNNKTFNLNFFLNETCKNAMNMSDFVSMIQPKIEDLEETGKLGYVTGISKLILNQLNEMEMDDRPVHCRDLKREVIYVKDKDAWNKETTEKPILTNAIKVVAHKNIKIINEWKQKHPDCSSYNSKYNKEYLKIVSNAMAGIDEEEINKNTSRIVSNIAKEVVIDK